MSEWLVAALTLIGVAFSVLAAVGIVRMPDLYMRMQAATKSATVGVSCLILAAAVRLETVEAITQALLVVAFLFFTVPVASHMIGRAAYASGVELWSETILDEYHSRAENQHIVSEESPLSNKAPSER